MGLNRLDLRGLKLSSSLSPVVKSSDLGKEVAAIDLKIPQQKINAENLKKDDIKKLLTKYGQDSDSKSIKNIESFEFDNKDSSLTINYKKGNISQKIINKDNSYQTIMQNVDSQTGQKEEICNFYNAHNILLKEKRSNSQSTIETYFDESNKIYKTVEFDKSKSSTTTVEFGENQSPQYKTVACGTTVTKFDYQGENSSERILEKTENKGLPIEKRQTYTYRPDGNVEIATFSCSTTSETENQSVSEYHKSNSEPAANESSSDVSGNKSDKINNSSADQSNVTVVYCSSSNFDPKTGTVKNPEQVSSTPPTQQADDEPYNQQDNTSHGQSGSSNTPNSQGSKPPETGSTVPDASKNPGSQSPETGSTVPNEPKKQGSQSPESGSTAPNEPKKQGSQPSEAPKPTVPNYQSSQSQRTDTTTTSNPTMSQESQGTSNILNTTTPQGTPPKGGPLSPRTADPLNSQQNVDVSIIKEQLEIIKKKFYSFISDYTHTDNLHVVKVSEKLGTDFDKLTQEILRNLEQSNDPTIKTKILKFVTEFDNVLSKTDVNFAEIKNKLKELQNIVQSEQNSSIENHKADSETFGETKTVSDITKFSTENGFKASEINSVVNKLNKGESSIVQVSKLIDTDAGTVTVTVSIKVEKTSDGTIKVTEVQNKAKGANTEEIMQLKSELMPLLPPDLRNKLKKCKTANELRNTIEQYIKEQKYTIKESVKPNIKNSDLQYVYILKDGEYQKVPANKTLSAGFTPNQELRLNVVADRELFNEISDIMSKGIYKTKSGKIIKLKTQNMMFKTAASINEWAEQTEPVVLSFEEPVSQEIETAIKEIAHKYRRIRTTGEKAELNTDANVFQKDIYADKKRNERIIEILNGLGFPNAQTAAFIASMVYVSSDGLRKTFVNKNSNETVLPRDESVNMKDSVD